MKDKILEEDLVSFCAIHYDWMDELKGKNILITGITGLIGSQIAKAILSYSNKFELNINLFGLARNKSKVSDIFQDNEDIQFVFGDVTDEIKIGKNIDCIIHCANTTSSKEYVDKPIETIKTIVSGTENLLELAKNQKKCSFVYLSSMEIYGVTNENLDFITENDGGYINTISPRSSYSEGKRLAECLCAAYAKEYNLNVKIARLAQVFGASVSFEDKRIFAELARCAIEKRDFVMKTHGNSYGNYCYTLDAIKAIIMLLAKGEKGEAYNVVNEDTYIRIGEMVERVALNNDFKVIYDIQDSPYAPDVKMHLSSKKLNQLGWRASVGLEQMYIRMIESMKYRLKNNF